MMAAAWHGIAENKNCSLAFEILLTPKVSEADFLELLERARELGWSSRSFFLAKIMEPDCTFSTQTISETTMSIIDEGGYGDKTAIAFLLGRFSSDEKVIAFVKSYAENVSNENTLSEIFFSFLDLGIDPQWVRKSALAFRKSNEVSSSIFNVLAQIGDNECTQQILNNFSSPLASEEYWAVNAAGKYLYTKDHVREALIAKATAGDSEACKWIIRRYPQDSRTVEILSTLLESPRSWLYFPLIPLMCVQGVMAPTFREWLVRSIKDPSWTDGFKCTALLALREQRELLADEITVHWENLVLKYFEFGSASLYLIWFPIEPLIGEIMAGLRTGNFLEGTRELLLHLAEYADIAPALQEGIIAASGSTNTDDAILLLGLIYGDRAQTASFMKSYVDLDPATRKYGSAAAFAEALRLSSCGSSDFMWAIDVMRRSSERSHGGVAKLGPTILLHFYGPSVALRHALEDIVRSSSNSILVDASSIALADGWPNSLPLDSRESVCKMSVDKRLMHLAQLARAVPPLVTELKYFSQHDPATEVRKAAIARIWRLMNWSKAPQEWKIVDFAIDCLSDEEVAGSAARILAKTCPQDEGVANALVSASTKFPDAGIVLQLLESFEEVPAARNAICEFVKASQDAASVLDSRPNCSCKVCMGFDLSLYGAAMVSLHSSPFQDDTQALKLRKDALRDPWIERMSALQIINVTTQNIVRSERSAYLEQIVRSDLEIHFRNAACEVLARMSETDDEPLARLLGLMRDEDMKLRQLAGKACGSLAVNARRNHRELHKLLKNEAEMTQRV